MAPADDTVASRLRAALDEKGVSVRAFAKDFGRDKSQINKWLNGTVTPSRKSALALARYFDKPDDWFLTPPEKRPARPTVEEFAQLRELVERLDRELADFRERFGSE